MKSWSLDSIWPRVISVADEISLTLLRTGFSPDIRENFDYGCAIYDTQGRMLAHGWPSATGHLSTIGRVVREVVIKGGLADTLEPGDVLMSNDPWLGSGHNADLFMITPIHHRGRIVGYAMNIVHQLDVGGRPNSPESRSAYEEGLRFPPLKLVKKGVLSQDIIEIVRWNVRFSDKVIGDLKAQIAANEAGAVRFRALLDTFDLPDLDEVGSQIFDRTEEGMRRSIALIPDGIYRGEIDIDDTDRFGNPLFLRVAVEVHGETVTVDFTGSSKQIDRAINCPISFTSAYSVVALKFVTDPLLPFNDGAYRPVTVRSEPGTIASAVFPAATFWRGGVGLLVPDVIVLAMRDAMPKVLPAGSGSLPVWLYTVHGTRADGAPFLLHSHCFGGTGGRPIGDGLSSTGFPYNIQDVATEVFENDTPLLCVRRELRENSGGPGTFRGGLGERVSLKALPGGVDPAHTIVIGGMFGRTKNGAGGVHGGLAGAIGRLEVDGVMTSDRSNQEVAFEHDQEFTFLLPGGGGYGPPSGRSPKRIARDLKAGYITIEHARAVYPGGVDEALRLLDAVEDLP